jgi:hypothetical protein
MAEQELNLDAAMDATMQETAESLAKASPDAPETAPEVAGDSISPEPSKAAATASAPPSGTPPDDFPRSWRAELKEPWGKLDPTVKAEVLRREQDILKGLGEYKEGHEFAAKLRKTLEPYMPTIEQAAGGDPFTAIQHLLNADHLLRYGKPEDKAAFLQQLAQQYGVAPAGETPYKDPYVRELEEKVGRIEATMTDAQRRAVAEMREKTSREVQVFASDTKHPYFDELADDIVKLIGAGFTLEDAYERSVWSNPATRQKELNRVQEDSKKLVEEKARKEAEAARKARGTNVTGRDSERRPTDPLGSWDDTMRETLANMKDRT